MKITLNFQGAEGLRVHRNHLNQDYRRPIRAMLPTVTPRMIGDVWANMGGIEYALRSFSLDLGLDLQPHINLAAPNGLDGIELRKDEPTGTLELFLDNTTKSALQDQLMGAPLSLFLQAGKGVGDPGVFAFHAPEIELTETPIADDAGSKTVTLNFRVTESPVSTLARWCIGVA